MNIVNAKMERVFPKSNDMFQLVVTDDDGNEWIVGEMQLSRLGQKNDEQIANLVVRFSAEARHERTETP